MTYSVSVWQDLVFHPLTSKVSGWCHNSSRRNSTFNLKHYYMKMAATRFSVILVSVIIVPVIIISCVLIITLIILPNAKLSETRVIIDTSQNRNRTDDQVQVTIPGSQSNQLFVVGLIFACGLFVCLIVAIVIAIILAKQDRGYLIGSDNQEQNLTNSGGNELCQLTSHKGTSGERSENLAKGEKLTPLAVKPLSKNHSLEDLNFLKRSDSEVLQGSGCTQKVRPQSYGTLSRTRLMSSVDEDGYHVDNFAYELDHIKDGNQKTIDENAGSGIDAKVQSILANLEDDLKTSSATSPVIEPDPFKNTPPPLKRQLTRQDTFESLPPLKSFDKYLTLVRIDSTSSFDSSFLEQSRSQWESTEGGGDEEVKSDAKDSL